MTTYYISGGSLQEGEADIHLRNKIQSALDNEDARNNFQQIRLDVKDNLRRHEYDNAVMNSTRLFEAWAKTAYIALEATKKDNEKEARRIAKETPFIPFVEQNLSSHIEGDVSEFREWDEWKSRAYEMRNKTIHEGKHVEEQVAQATFTQTKRLIARLAKEFEEELRELPLFPTIENYESG